MKTFKTLILIYFFTLLSVNVMAQVSGFLGKKNIISANLFIKSSFVMPNKNGENGYLSFNDHYSIEYERVINRRNSIKFHLTTFESMYNLFGNSINIYDNINTFSTKGFGADYVIYRRNYIAPLGAYISVGFDVFMSNVNYDTAVIRSLYPFDLNDLNKNSSNTIHFGGNFKSGIKQIFFKCISMDINFQLGLLAADYDDDSYAFNINEIDSYIRKQVGVRLWGHYLWGVNCSVGYVF
jgi:hypothetical protein